MSTEYVCVIDIGHALCALLFVLFAFAFYEPLFVPTLHQETETRNDVEQTECVGVSADNDVSNLSPSELHRAGGRGALRFLSGLVRAVFGVYGRSVLSHLAQARFLGVRGCHRSGVFGRLSFWEKAMERVAHRESVGVSLSVDAGLAHPVRGDGAVFVRFAVLVLQILYHDVLRQEVRAGIGSERAPILQPLRRPLFVVVLAPNPCLVRPVPAAHSLPFCAQLRL